MSNPTKFSVEETIPSCYVTKKLLIELEEYLIKRISEVNSEGQAKVKEKYNVTIRSRSGTEEIKSIKDHQEDKFSDDVESISLYYHDYSGDRRCRVAVNFYPSRFSSDFIMELYCANARTHVADTQLKVMHVLSKAKTLSWTFNPTLGVTFAHVLLVIPLLLALALVLNYLKMSITSGEAAWGALVYCAGLLVYFFLLPKLKPYSTIDTPWNDAVKGKINALVWSLFTVIVVSWPVGFLLNKLIGR